MANNVSEWPICIPYLECNQPGLFSGAKQKLNPVN